MASTFYNQPLRLPKVPHSMQNLGTRTKTTGQFGTFIPVYTEEVLTGDKIVKFGTNSYVKLSPLIYPIMHNVRVRSHTFEVPFRIILGDDNFEKFINGELDLPSVTIEQPSGYTIPKYDIFTSLGYPKKTFENGSSGYVLENGLDFLSIVYIWSTWFADSQLQKDAIEYIELLLENYRIALREKQHNVTFLYNFAISNLSANLGKDYYTTARYEPQDGVPMQVLPTPLEFTSESTSNDGSARLVHTDQEHPGNTYFLYGPEDGYALSVDMSIRELWRKEQIERYFEVRNMFGRRHREWAAGHFGVNIPDYRLQIPRLLQTTVNTVGVSEVLQTSSSTETSPLGSYAGRGSVFTRSKRMWSHFVFEPGLIITLMSIIPETGYCDTRPRFQLKKNILDFASPEFNNIGFQEIFKGEVFRDCSDEEKLEAWAYVPRYSEYRSHPNRSYNAFNENPMLDFHLNRKFTNLPGLNPDFIKANQAEFARIFTDTDAEEDLISFLIDVDVENTMSRPISIQPVSMHL